MRETPSEGRYEDAFLCVSDGTEDNGTEDNEHCTRW